MTRGSPDAAPKRHRTRGAGPERPSSRPSGRRPSSSGHLPHPIQLPGIRPLPISIWNRSICGLISRTLTIHVNMTFPAIPCDVLSVDAIDMSGKHEVDLDTNIWKLRLSRDGCITGSEYMSDLVEKEHSHDKHENGHDHHEDSSQKKHDHGFGEDSDKMITKVKQTIAKGEGCRVYGFLDVQRLAGNFHISVHGLNIFVAQQLTHFGTTKSLASHNTSGETGALDNIINQKFAAEEFHEGNAATQEALPEDLY